MTSKKLCWDCWSHYKVHDAIHTAPGWISAIFFVVKVAVFAQRYCIAGLHIYCQQRYFCLSLLSVTFLHMEVLKSFHFVMFLFLNKCFFIRTVNVSISNRLHVDIFCAILIYIVGWITLFRLVDPWWMTLISVPALYSPVFVVSLNTQSSMTENRCFILVESTRNFFFLLRKSPSNSFAIFLNF